MWPAGEEAWAPIHLSTHDGAKDQSLHRVIKVVPAPKEPMVWGLERLNGGHHS